MELLQRGWEVLTLLGDTRIGASREPVRDATEEEHRVVLLVLDEHVDRLATIFRRKAEVLLCRMESLHREQWRRYRHGIPEQSIRRGPVRRDHEWICTNGSQSRL